MDTDSFSNNDWDLRDRLAFMIMNATTGVTIWTGECLVLLAG